MRGLRPHLEVRLRDPLRFEETLRAVGAREGADDDPADVEHAEEDLGGALRRAGADVDPLEPHARLRVEGEARAAVELHVGVAEAVELLASVVDQLLVELDADVDGAPPGDVRDERRHVPGPRADVEHRVPLLELERLERRRIDRRRREVQSAVPERHVHVDGFFRLLVVDELAAVDRAEGGDDLRAKRVVRGWMDVFGGRIARLLREANVVLELVNHGIIAPWAVPELAEEALQCHFRGARGVDGWAFAAR